MLIINLPHIDIFDTIQLKRQKTTYVKWNRNVFVVVKSARGF